MPRPDKVMTKQDYADKLGVTRQTVMNWIYQNNDLLTELQEAGWTNPFNRYWKPVEIKILNIYLKNKKNKVRDDE